MQNMKLISSDPGAQQAQIEIGGETFKVKMRLWSFNERREVVCSGIVATTRTGRKWFPVQVIFNQDTLDFVQVFASGKWSRYTIYRICEVWDVRRGAVTIKKEVTS